MNTLIHHWVTDCQRGINPRTVCRVESGWVVLGEAQFLRGYSLLLPDPVVPHFNSLEPELRRKFMYDASAVGDALLNLTEAVRINYEMLGNLEPALHMHIFPRYVEEDPGMKSRPAWFYDWESSRKFDLQEDESLMEDMRTFLRKAGVLVALK
jgi:diadenosine tetraphosphate (Ap4A) HIT family hydrolase